MTTLLYRVILRPEPEGGYTATVPTLPGCITYGGDVDEAIVMAREAIELYVESLLAHGEDVPTEEGTLEYTLASIPISTSRWPTPAPENPAATAVASRRPTGARPPRR